MKHSRTICLLQEEMCADNTDDRKAKTRERQADVKGRGKRGRAVRKGERARKGERLSKTLKGNG
jgi:hypothetical protein